MIRPLTFGVFVVGVGVGVGLVAPATSADAAEPAEAAVVAGAPPVAAATPRGEPNADRVILMPTAATQPEGSFTFSSYDIVLLQGTYGITDRTQVSLTLIPPLGELNALPLDVSLKKNFVRQRLVRAAAQASVSGAWAEGMALGVGRLGGVVDFCLTATCRSTVSLGSNVVFVGAILTFNTVGAVLRVSDGVALLFEAASLIPLNGRLGRFAGTLASAGVRFPGTHWSFDLALAKSVFSQGGLPLLVLSYRPS